MAAKDGSNRGGARPGAGRKKKALTDKIQEGKQGAEFPDGVDLRAALIGFPIRDCVPGCLHDSGEFRLAYPVLVDPIKK